jgi:hypothetical protein
MGQWWCSTNMMPMGHLSITGSSGAAVLGQRPNLSENTVVRMSGPRKLVIYDV